MYRTEIPHYLKTVLPTALPASVTLARWMDEIGIHFGYEANQLLLGTSLCSDDIVAMEFPEVTREMLGPFQLGGLNGFPFAGLSGIKAFEAHVPKNGALTLVYGPHLGFTEDGVIGMVLRTGQKYASPCCGAAIAALRLLKDGTLQAGQQDELDFEEDTLKRILFRQKERILQAIFPEVEATRVIYEAIDERILLLLQKSNPSVQHIFGLGVLFLHLDAGNLPCMVVNRKAIWNGAKGSWDEMPA